MIRPIHTIFLFITLILQFTSIKSRQSTRLADHDCDKLPCNNGGICLPQIVKSDNMKLVREERRRTYSCLCGHEFEGKNCELLKNMNLDRNFDILSDLQNISRGTYEFKDDYLFGGQPRNWKYKPGNFKIRETKAFNFKELDLMSVLHIQKTSGTTLGRHLTRHTGKCKLKSPKGMLVNGKKKAERWYCHRYQNKEYLWLFSRMSNGWKCGLHADFTEMKECQLLSHFYKKLKQRMVTTLRNPVERYISEWLHMKRGATWKGSKLGCNGVDYSGWNQKDEKKDEKDDENGEKIENFNVIEPCYNKTNWFGVTLPEFMACKTNLANNRQVRMLANLNLTSGECAYKYIFPCPSYEAQNPDNIQHVQIYGEKYHQSLKIVMFDSFLKISVIFSRFTIIFSSF